MINNKLLKGAAAAGGLVPSENFNTVIYSNPGLSTPISVGFGPDMVLFKERNGINSWQLYDTVRGDDYALYTNLSDAQYNYSTHPNGDLSPTITSTGFTTPPVTNNGINNSSNFVSYSWKGGGATVTNSVGTITSQVSANTDAGFSIVSYTANGTDGSSVGHSLSSAPEMIFYKGLNATGDWVVLTTAIDGSADYLFLNTTAAKGDYPSAYIPTSTTFASISSSSTLQTIAYCFHSVDGYSKVGKYTGTGGLHTEILGFEPAWVIIKRTDASGAWMVFDNKRNTTNPRNAYLSANTTNSEFIDTNVSTQPVAFTTTGMIIGSGVNGLNGTESVNVNNGNYIFYAIAADPDTTTPTLAKSFNIDAYTGNGGTQQIGSVNTLFTKYAVFNNASNASTSFITLPNFMPTGNNSRTASLWIKSSRTTYQEIFTYGVDGTGTSFIFRINSGGSNKLGISFYAMDNDFTAQSINDGKWHHCVATYDGNLAKVYYDGTLIGTSNSITINTTGSTAKISGYGYLGSIDQVRVYNTALNQAAVTQLYNETQATASTLNYPTGLGGLALYEFNDNGETTPSSSNNGTASNVTYDSFLFKPDLVIIKNRDANDGWRWFDTQRGVLNRLESSATSAAANLANSLTSFNNAGFTIGSEATVNTSGEKFISYSFKMLDSNNNAAIENEVGTIDSLVSANPSAGMSITKYTGNGTQNATIGHGLTSSPDMVIIKNLGTSDDWFVAHSSLGNNEFLELARDYAASTNSALTYERLSTTFKTTASSPHSMINANGNNYVMYSFHSVAGFSKFSSYQGDNSSSGNIIYTTDNGQSGGSNGFKPSFLMIKRATNTNSAGNWVIYDDKRDTTNPNTAVVAFDKTSAESAFAGGYDIDFLNNGFELKASGIAINNNETYIYWAMKIN